MLFNFHFLNKNKWYSSKYIDKIFDFAPLSTALPPESNGTNNKPKKWHYAVQNQEGTVRILFNFQLV